MVDASNYKCDELYTTKHNMEEDMAIHSCLENPMDRGAWQAAVHRVAKSQIWLSTKHMHANEYNRIRIPGGPVATIWCFHYQSLDLLTGWETKMLQEYNYLN